MTAASVRNYGVRLISIAGILGAAVSLYNYFSAESGISGTPGAMLVVVSSAVLFLFGFAIGVERARRRSWRVVISVACLLVILGTAFAGYLLNSQALVVLMVVALLGWCLYLVQPRHATSTLAFLLLLPLGMTESVQAQQQTWRHFNRDRKAQKYSPHTQITPDNVKSLACGVEDPHGRPLEWHGPYAPSGTHVGGASAAGKIPATVWSATPLFVNDTVYLGTPFYRIFALEPDTGKIKWTYDTKAVLEALTQPDLKNRGVAYWQAEKLVPGDACQKRVYIGTMDAKLHAVDADTGKPCTDFGSAGIVDVNRWNVLNNKWPLSILQPPTVYKDYLFVGWAGKDWAESEAPPGTIFALDARTGEHALDLSLDSQGDRSKDRHRECMGRMSVDTERKLLYIPVSSPSPNFFGGNRLTPSRSVPQSPRSTSRPARSCGAANWSITTFGITIPTPRRRWWTSRRTARPFPL